MASSAACEQLNDLLKCDPSGTNRDQVAAHIASCPVCQKIIAGNLGTVALHDRETASAGAWKLLGETMDSAAPTVVTADQGATQSPNLNLPGYEVLEELGRGGMGVVYKARQVALDRLVAIKMIRSAAIAGANQLARFKTEAAALAQLQHSNIVQVFEIGQHQDMPYLSMEFVAGATLAHAIEAQPLTPQQAASMVEKLARAMFSAHQRGVLHRDLKPSNVLIAADGEPKITDFGLAKRVGSDSQLTVDHTVMGTPSYMPPEQALGRIAEIGPRSDVYSLGAILYELLTRRPPFRGTMPMETIQRVIHDEPLAPRTINPRIPRDLETICLKCLHKQPAQRFDTAADLADDLRRFQRNEPILARRVTLLERGWRWCLRNPALTGAMAVTCLVILAGIAGVAWQSHQTQQARSLAQQRFQLYTAESAQKFALIQDLMERVPEEERAQDERLQSALASYEEWLAEEPSDDAARASYAEALYRIAEIRRRIGQFQLADEMGLKAQDRYQQLADQSPQDLNHLHGLAKTLVLLGETYRESGQLPKAISAYEQAMQLQTEFAAKAAPDPLHGAEFARTLYNRGLALRDLNRLDEAEQDLRQSIDLLEKSRRERQQDATIQQDQARARINLGILLRATKRPKEANDEYVAAIILLEELEEQHPQAADYRFELATALMNRANLLLSDPSKNSPANDEILETVEATYKSSVDKLRKLSSQYSNVPRYRKELANSLNGLGAALSTMGQDKKAEEAWLAAAEELKLLVERRPTVAEYSAALAQVNFNLAYLHRDDPPDATEHESFLRVAVAQQRKAHELSPKNVIYLRTLRTCERALSRVLVDRGKHVAAAEVAHQLALRSADDVSFLYAAAKVLAQCAVVAELDPMLDANHLSEYVNRYRTKATVLVITCQKQGLTIKPEDFPGINVGSKPE